MENIAELRQKYKGSAYDDMSDLQIVDHIAGQNNRHPEAVAYDLGLDYHQLKSPSIVQTTQQFFAPPNATDTNTDQLVWAFAIVVVALVAVYYLRNIVKARLSSEHVSNRNWVTNSTLDAEKQEEIFSIIANEIKTGNMQTGLWTMLYAQCGGDETLTKVKYIEARSSQLGGKL
jgi:hypothetical protein